MIVTVAKMGTGETPETAIRPNTTVVSWRVLEERETEFIIEILE